MPDFPSTLLLLAALLFGLAPLRAESAAPAPVLAIPPAILQKKPGSHDTDEKEGAPLAERVQLALQADPAPGCRFVERIALDTLLREQSLALTGSADPVSAVRAGRLLHADWLLRLRLRADDPRPRVEVEVVDALRADLLGRAETPLSSLPDESWLLRPTDAAVEVARATAARALAAAASRSASVAGRTILAPLSFLDRDQSERLAPLGRLLHAALHAGHPGIRVLGYERPDGAMDESTLFQAGMIDLEAADWARVADVFLWGEFFEDTARKDNEPPVLLRLWLWRDGAEPQLLSFRGDFSSLDSLAREAAAAVLAAAAGGRVDASEATRARAARRLLDAAAVFEPAPNLPWDRSPLNQARQQARLRFLTLAAFFAPENPLLRERVTSLGLSLSPDAAARAACQRQFWHLIDQFLIGPDGSPNLALLARAGGYDACFPGYPARFERIGRILARHPLDDTVMRDICARFSDAGSALPLEPGLAAARAAMQPVLRRLKPDPGPVYLEIPTPPPPAGPVFTAWEKRPPGALLAAAGAGPLVNAPALEAPELRFFPWQLTPRAGEDAPSTGITSVVVGDEALWLTLSGAPDRAGVRLHSSARIDLRTHEIEWLPARLQAEKPVSAFWLEGARVWMSTRGNGLRMLDQATRKITVIDQVSGGLPLADVPGLYRGSDGLYLDSVARFGVYDTVVARIDPETAAVGQAVAPDDAGFSTLPPALRAAIASFGDDAPRRVRLPDEPAIGFDDAAFVPAEGAPVPAGLPSGHRLAPGAGGRYSEDDDPGFARQACLTGPRDGYWVASHHSLAWAAGSRRVSVAHWISGCIRSLADDGRFLFVQVLRRDSPGDASRGGSPSSVRIYVYDHGEGRWLGWMSVSQSGAMHAGPGLLALIGFDSHPLLLVNTSRLGGSPAASVAPVATATSPTGWTPLLSALWADDAPAVERLLAAGARWDVADARGWFPLQLAAAWSSPACLEALLRHGVPGGQARPAPDPALPLTYAAAVEVGTTALHAAVLANRAAIVDRLLAAGASPTAYDPHGGSPVELAVHHASPGIVARLFSQVSGEEYREPLRITADLCGRKDLLAVLGAPARDPTVAAILASRSRDPDRQLREAVDSTPPDLALARTALEAGADPAQLSGRSGPILPATARDGKFAAFELLLGFVKPGPLNEVHRSFCLGRETLRELLVAKRPDLVRKFFAAGYRPVPLPDDKSQVRPSVLWLAVLTGDADLVRQLRRAGFPPRIEVDRHPLREAVGQRNAGLLRALLEPLPDQKANFDVDDSAGNGRTAIFEAADAGWAEGVRILLAAGSTSLCGDEAARRSLRDAAAPWPEVALLLNRRPGAPDNQPAGAEAVAAIFRNDASLATLPLDSAVLRYRDLWGWTPLHHAARKGRFEFVGRLLAAHADPNELTGAGESPLCLAVFGGDITCVDLFLTVRAQPNLYRAQGWLPLLAAARSARVDLVKRLLAAGADPNLRSGPDSSTPALLAAATRDEIETLRLLVTAGASLTVTDNAGRGALEAAVLSDSAEKIQYLVDHGVRWQKPGSADYHPMDVAAREGLTGSIRKLQQLGLQSPRALSLARDDATRALLQGDPSEAGRRFRADEEEWPGILADSEHWRERAEAHLKAGGDVNHLSEQWGTPLKLAVWQNDPARVAFLVGRGADASYKIEGGVGYVAQGTAFYGWIDGQTGLREKSGALLAERDSTALAYLEIFWKHDRDPRLRKQMLEWAETAGLSGAAAWMRGNLER